MVGRAETERAVRRTAVIAVVGQLAFAAVMVVAALDQDDPAGFWLLALSGVLGAAAAALLGGSTPDARQGWITAATALVAVSFAAGAVAAFVAGSPAYVLGPAVLVLVDAMVVAAARRVHSSVA